MGRPPLPKRERKNNLLGVRFSADERKRLMSAADASDATISTWARDALIAIADTTAGKMSLRDFLCEHYDAALRMANALVERGIGLASDSDEARRIRIAHDESLTRLNRLADAIKRMDERANSSTRR